MNQLEPLVRLTEQLQRLPSIGAKSAQRLAFHLLKQPREEVDQLCDAIRDVKERIHLLLGLLECHRPRPLLLLHRLSRDRRVICVVENPHDVAAIEKDRGFQGGLSRVDGGAVAAEGASDPMTSTSRGCSTASAPAMCTR